MDSSNKLFLAGEVYCGPYAIAALTGLPASQVEHAVRLYRTRTRSNQSIEAVTVLWSREIDGVLAILGWRVIGTSPPEHYTFAGWRRQFSGDGLWLVLITGHYVAVSMDGLVDTRFREPVSLDAVPYGRKMVKRAWRIEPYVKAQ